MSESGGSNASNPSVSDPAGKERVIFFSSSRHLTFQPSSHIKWWRCGFVRQIRHSSRGNLNDGDGDYDTWTTRARRDAIRPEDQLELNETELSEEITKVLQTDNTNYQKNLVVYSFKEGGYIEVRCILLAGHRSVIVIVLILATTATAYGDTDPIGRMLVACWKRRGAASNYRNGNGYDERIQHLHFHSHYSSNQIFRLLIFLSRFL